MVFKYQMKILSSLKKVVIITAVLCGILFLENIASIKSIFNGGDCDTSIKNENLWFINIIIYIVTRTISGMSSQYTALFIFWQPRIKYSSE